MKGVTGFGVGSSNSGRKVLRMACQLGDEDCQHKFSKLWSSRTELKRLIINY